MTNGEQMNEMNECNETGANSELKRNEWDSNESKNKNDFVILRRFNFFS